MFVKEIQETIKGNDKFLELYWSKVCTVQLNKRCIHRLTPFSQHFRVTDRVEHVQYWIPGGGSVCNGSGCQGFSINGVYVTSVNEWWILVSNFRVIWHAKGYPRCSKNFQSRYPLAGIERYSSQLDRRVSTSSAFTLDDATPLPDRKGLNPAERVVSSWFILGY